jgi:membrane-bound metal-dependent hydrolase YbcI (DUF457 family)
MTPLGHVSVSYIAGRWIPGLSMPAVLLGGLMMDLDFIFFPFSFFNAIHRLWTHNLLFLAAVTVVAALVTRSRRKETAAGLLVGGLLHLTFDAVLDNNPSNGIGVALFYPLNSTFFSFADAPVPLSGIAHSAGWTDPVSQVKGAGLALLWEAPFCACALLLAAIRYVQRRRGHG